MPVTTNTAANMGNRKFAGNDASTCTTGCASRDILGFNPIHTPMGTQISVAKMTTTTTRPKVTKPKQQRVTDLAETNCAADEFNGR